MRQTGTSLEKFSFFVSFLALVGVIWFINQCDKLINDNFYKINNEKFKKFNLMWGELWADLKIVKDDKPRFNLIFMTRRLVYAAIIVIPAGLGILPLFQMVMVIYLNLWLCKYLADHRPFETKSQNFIEFFNEYCNLCISILLIVQNNFKNGDELYNMGMQVTATQ